MRYVLILTILLFTNCESKKTDKTAKQKSPTKDGVIKSTYPDGTTQKEITMKGGKKNGRAKEYFKNGKVSMEIDYVDDLKHGTLTRYYETGLVFKELTYEEGKQTGIEKRYKSNGKLTAEIPYKDDNPCVGLKEYLVSGEPRKKYPTIVVKPIDTILKDGRYILEISMSDGSKQVEYYRGELLPGDCLSNFMGNIFEGKKKGTGEIKYMLPSGGFVMDQINIVAKVKTLQGNYFITQRKYNVAIENRY